MGFCAALPADGDEDTKTKKSKKKAERRPASRSSKSKKKKKIRTSLTPKQREAIILEHREHGKRLAWSFLSSWRIRLAQDEVTSVVGAALCEAAMRFDPSKEVAFKTFFFYHLRGMLLKEISHVINEQKILQLVPSTFIADAFRADELVPSNWSKALMDKNNPERIVEKKQVAEVCWEACAQLDDLEQEVLIRYFVYDEPLVEIARDLQYCRCHISRVKSRALGKMGKMLKSSAVVKERLRPEKIAELEEIELPRMGSKATKSYTGGRGRRKTKKSENKRSVILQKMIQEMYATQ